MVGHPAVGELGRRGPPARNQGPAPPPEARRRSPRRRPAGVHPARGVDDVGRAQPVATGMPAAAPGPRPTGSRPVAAGRGRPSRAAAATQNRQKPQSASYRTVSGAGARCAPTRARGEPAGRGAAGASSRSRAADRCGGPRRAAPPARGRPSVPKRPRRALARPRPRARGRRTAGSPSREPARAPIRTCNRSRAAARGRKLTSSPWPVPNVGVRPRGSSGWTIQCSQPPSASMTPAPRTRPPRLPLDLQAARPGGGVDRPDLGRSGPPAGEEQAAAEERRAVDRARRDGAGEPPHRADRHVAGRGWHVAVR